MESTAMRPPAGVIEPHLATRSRLMVRTYGKMILAPLVNHYAEFSRFRVPAVSEVQAHRELQDPSAGIVGVGQIAVSAGRLAETGADGRGPGNVAARYE